MIKMGMKMVGLTAVMTMFDRVIDRYRINADYYVGTNVDYAAYIEYGTYRMQAQPYLRPAANKVRGNLKDIISRQSNMEGAIKAVALEVESDAKRRCPVDTGNLRGSIETQKA